MQERAIIKYHRVRLYEPGTEVELQLPARATVMARPQFSTEKWAAEMVNFPPHTRGHVQQTQVFTGETFSLIAGMVPFPIHTIPPLLEVIAIGKSFLLFATQVKLVSNGQPLYEVRIGGTAQRVVQGRFSFLERAWRYMARGETFVRLTAKDL
jgi:hypothetical protein